MTIRTPKTTRFSVIITRDITESVVIEVSAKNADLARDAALEWLATCDNPEWAVDDGSCGTSPAYITDCSEV
ncbi:MAG: hypothetical protein Q8K33_01590 [Cypionkella sp.]|uniref:hypothetical protein n=1 Tax=Cypionkella sp. TaxID=2811411 RepID=UPI002730819E|nr:hypothetical protein [Cypionkella sp.]MDP2047574.1 hypothetical protein [Cypionkella sp.]